MNNKNKVMYMTRAALVASMYFVLTWISNLFGLASGAIQVRISEALCVLPFFMPSAVPGLFIGCLIANLSMGSLIIDVIFGAIATFIGGYFGGKLKNKWLVPIPTVVANTVIVPFVILFCYTEVRSLGVYLTITLGVFIGELISAYILGMILLFAIDKRKGLFNGNKQMKNKDK